jgi:hypothetical protein
MRINANQAKSVGHSNIICPYDHAIVPRDCDAAERASTEVLVAKR